MVNAHRSFSVFFRRTKFCELQKIDINYDRGSGSNNTPIVVSTTKRILYKEGY